MADFVYVTLHSVDGPVRGAVRELWLDEGEEIPPSGVVQKFRWQMRNGENVAEPVFREVPNPLVLEDFDAEADLHFRRDDAGWHLTSRIPWNRP